MSNSIKAYVLMGLKHCGKTTQGKIISQKYGLPFADTDELIEQEKQMTVREIYAKEGVVSYTLAEQVACETIAKEWSGKSIIVSAGGGICDNPPGLNALREIGPFVFLNLNMDYAISRVESKIKQDEAGRWINAPAYVLSKSPQNMADVHRIMVEKFKNRIDQYLHIADIVVPISPASIETNTEEILKVLF